MPDGTRKYIRAKTQEELDEKVLKAQVLVNAGEDICSEETFGHFAQMWYDLYKKPYLRKNSLIAIRYALNQYILPAIGGCRIRDITPMQIQAIMAGLSGKSNSVQSRGLINLRSIFNTARENGLTVKSPVSNMLKPGGRKTPEKEDRSGEQAASGAGQEHPGEDVPADGPSHGDAARGDRGAPVRRHRLRGHSHPAQRRDRPL